MSPFAEAIKPTLERIQSKSVQGSLQLQEAKRPISCQLASSGRASKSDTHTPYCESISGQDADTFPCENVYDVRFLTSYLQQQQKPGATISKNHRLTV